MRHVYETGTAIPVAIVGIGCRLPGGISGPKDLVAFLSAHGDAVTEIPQNRWSVDLYHDPQKDAPGKAYVKHGGFLTQDVFEFDPAPFGISPREADRLDPQQRLLLEVAWEALEDASIPIERIRGTNTSVFMGGFTLDHQNLLYSEDNRRLLDAHTAVGASLTILSNRISYTFDLHGPSMTVDTGCSSSLVATHLAYRSVAYDGCELSIVGGANVMISPATMVTMCKGQFLAADGRSKSFSAAADGYGRGEGAGVIVLKRLDSALRDGNRIYAVLRASGVNQDGRTDAMPVPSEDAQRALADSVRKAAGLAPGDIGYIEAHGTGTRVGDPIEARAIGSVYGAMRSTPARIGSIKTNIGHLEAGAGITGLIKAALSVHTRTILPQRDVGVPNPDIPFERLGLQVAAEAEPWPLPGVAHAAVNSFGYGGTNAHVIVSEWRAPEGKATEAIARAEPSLQLVPVSAASPGALVAQAAQLATAAPADVWRDVSYTLARHRSHLTERMVVLASSGQELSDALAKFGRGEAVAECVVGRASTERKLLWVFTGMGPQWFAMGRELYGSEPIFREAVDAADAAFAKVSGASIVREMLRDEAHSQMHSNSIAQAANFVLQVGLVAMLRARGVPCDGVLGHSVGELAAAWAAGCLTLEQAAFAAYHRSRIQQKVAGKGTMLAAGIGEEEAAALLRDIRGATIATYNSPRSLTFAGGSDALARIAARLTERQAFHRMMNVEVAYHSDHMDPLREEFLDSLAELAPKTPEVPLYSTVRGTREDGPIHDARYLWENARLPVLLQRALERSIEDGYSAFLEIGPHPVLGGAIREVLEACGKDGKTVSCLKRKQPEQLTLLRAVAELHVAGVAIDFARLHPRGTARELPHYPFQRTRHWVESEASRELRMGREDASALLPKKDRGPTLRYSSDLARPNSRYIEDHRVQGAILFPAAGFVEAALAVCSTLRGPVAQVLQDVRFKRPLVVRMAASPELVIDVDDDYSTVRFFARHGEDPWERPAEARIARETRMEARTIDLDALRAEHTEQQDTSATYLRFAQMGLEYGPRFQPLREVRLRRESPREASVLARLRAVTPGEDSAAARTILLDGALQAVLSVVHDATTPILPVGIGELSWTGNAASPAWAYGRVSISNDGELRADLTLTSDRGEVLMEMHGLVCRGVDRRVRSESDQELRYFHRDTWRRSLPSAQGWVAPGSWAVVGTARSFSAALADALATRGANVVVLEDCKAEALAHYDTVVFAAQSNATETAAIDLCDRLLVVAKAAKDAGSKLCVITFGAHDVLGGERVDPHQGALCGLSRVLMTEWPELGCRHLDVSASSPDVASAAALLTAEDTEEEAALRVRDVYVRRLRRDESVGEVADRVVPRRTYTGAFQLKAEGDGSFEYLANDHRDPGDGEIEVEVFAASLEGAGSAVALSADRWSTLRPESVTGRVVRTGPGVSGASHGDRVHLLAPGPIASHVVVACARATPILPIHSDVEATAYSPFFAAWYALGHVARLERDSVLLVNGADTALGIAAVSIGRIRGARVFATVSERESEETLRASGALGIESSDRPDGVARIRAAAGPIDVVLNTSSGPARSRAIAALRPSGCFLDLAQGDREAIAAGFERSERRSLTYARIDLAEVCVERPDRYAAVAREVLAALAKGDLQLPAATVLSPHQVAASAASGTRKGTARVVVDLSERDGSVRVRPIDLPLFRADRTYLVTGGLSGFGLATAEWLVQEGARTVVLGSRRGTIDGDAAPAVRRMREQGATVKAVTLDVSARTSVEAVLADIHARLAPLAGVVHSAAVLEDRPLREVDRASLERVLRVKALGAWHLHEATLTLGLEHFIVFSSTMALVGNPHQATYAAANTFLDALASDRKALGLPATSVSWGALGDVGLVARDEATQAYLRRLGFPAIPKGRALAALKRALLQGCTKIAIVDAEWDRWTASFSRTPWNRLEELREDASAADPLARLRDELRPLAREAQKKLVAAKVSQEAAAVLHADAERLDTNVPLHDLGLDSIIAVELQVALEASVGISIPMIELIAGASVGTIVHRTLERLQASPMRSEVPSYPPAEPPPRGSADETPADWRSILSPLDVDVGA